MWNSEVYSLPSRVQQTNKSKMAQRQFPTFHFPSVKSLVAMSLIELPTMNQKEGDTCTVERIIKVGKI